MSDAAVLHLPADLTRLDHEPAWRAGHVLDLRAAKAFADGHLPDAVNLPLSDATPLAAAPFTARLRDRVPSIFLPPRAQPLAVVVAHPSEALAVLAHLRSRGRDQVIAVVWPPQAAMPAPWQQTGPSHGVLWRPAAFLARWHHLLPPPAAGPVLDVACGSGRAAVWLAERGYRVTGVDHDAEALGLARRLATSRGVHVTLVEADLRRPGNLPAGPWAAILIFRYLQRDLVRALPRHLVRGGVVMMQTFRDAPGYVGNPSPQHRLARGELLALLPSHLYDRWVHAEGFAGDGRPVAGIVARCADRVVTRLSAPAGPSC